MRGHTGHQKIDQLDQDCGKGTIINFDKTPQILTPEEISGISWHISSQSPNAGGSCVEAGPLADGSGRVAVRHSHYPDGTMIVYTRAEWDAFLSGAKDGEFNFAG